MPRESDHLVLRPGLDDESEVGVLDDRVHQQHEGGRDHDDPQPPEAETFTDVSGMSTGPESGIVPNASGGMASL